MTFQLVVQVLKREYPSHLAQERPVVELAAGSMSVVATATMTVALSCASADNAKSQLRLLVWILNIFAGVGSAKTLDTLGMSAQCAKVAAEAATGIVLAALPFPMVDVVNCWPRLL